ncbi:MAG TPA: hypothetical protein VGM78_14115 [Ilumatobacteraceae bacterium]
MLFSPGAGTDVTGVVAVTVGGVVATVDAGVDATVDGVVAPTVDGVVPGGVVAAEVLSADDDGAGVSVEEGEAVGDESLQPARAAPTTAAPATAAPPAMNRRRVNDGCSSEGTESGPGSVTTPTVPRDLVPGSTVEQGWHR